LNRPPGPELGGAELISLVFNHLSGASTVSVLLDHASLGGNVNPTIATRARVSFQSLMSYLKDYVEGKLPVYRHSSRHSQEIRFIRFSTCSRRTRSSNATRAGFHCRGNPSRNPGLRPYSPALRAPHRAVGSRLSSGSPEVTTACAAAPTRLAKHRGGRAGIPRLIL
jgi:hypothetical protein